MKARLVIDDVTAEPHEFVFRGHTYDLQKTFSVTKAMLEHTENDGKDVDIPMVALAAMMNDYANFRSGGKVPPVTVDELVAFIPADQFVEVSDFIRDIINPAAAEKIDAPELDALIDKEVPEDVAKN